MHVGAAPPVPSVAGAGRGCIGRAHGRGSCAWRLASASWRAAFSWVLRHAGAAPSCPHQHHHHLHQIPPHNSLLLPALPAALRPLPTCPLLPCHPLQPADQVFTFERWNKHRNSMRYAKHLLHMFTSRVFRQLLGPVLAVMALALFVAVYETLVGVSGGGCSRGESEEAGRLARAGRLGGKSCSPWAERRSMESTHASHTGCNFTPSPAPPSPSSPPRVSSPCCRRAACRGTGPTSPWRWGRASTSPPLPSPCCSSSAPTAPTTAGGRRASCGGAWSTAHATSCARWVLVGAGGWVAGCQGSRDRCWRWWVLAWWVLVGASLVGAGGCWHWWVLAPVLALAQADAGAGTCGNGLGLLAALPHPPAPLQSLVFSHHLPPSLPIHPPSICCCVTQAVLSYLSPCSPWCSSERRTSTCASCWPSGPWPSPRC